MTPLQDLKGSGDPPSTRNPSVPGLLRDLKGFKGYKSIINGDRHRTATLTLGWTPPRYSRLTPLKTRQTLQNRQNPFRYNGIALIGGLEPPYETVELSHIILPDRPSGHLNPLSPAVGHASQPAAVRRFDPRPVRSITPKSERVQ
jgi:hypothetical protein